MDAVALPDLVTRRLSPFVGKINGVSTAGALADSILDDLRPYLREAPSNHQPVGCRAAFEQWSKEQGWEIEGWPDARQRWTVWKAAAARKDADSLPVPVSLNGITNKVVAAGYNGATAESICRIVLDAAGVTYA